MRNEEPKRAIRSALRIGIGHWVLGILCAFGTLLLALYYTLHTTHYALITQADISHSSLLTPHLFSEGRH